MVNKIKYTVNRILQGEQSGIGVVEIILILVVLVGIVLIFRDQITQLVDQIFNRITDEVGGML